MNYGLLSDPEVCNPKINFLCLGNSEGDGNPSGPPFRRWKVKNPHQPEIQSLLFQVFYHHLSRRHFFKYPSLSCKVKRSKGPSCATKSPWGRRLSSAAPTCSPLRFSHGWVDQPCENARLQATHLLGQSIPPPPSSQTNPTLG